MVEGTVARPPEGEAGGAAGVPGPWLQGVDRALPWVMAGWATLGFCTLPIDETFHVDNGASLTALLATVVLVWALLAGTASGLALQHAFASAGLTRIAWCVVPAVTLLAMPLALAFLAEQDYTEDDDAVCSTGLLPAGFGDAIFDWFPGQAYRAVPAVTALIGLGFLLPDATRRAGAWILANTVLGFSLWWAGLALVINHCD